MRELKRNQQLATIYGQTIKVLEKLGEGGQGIVYKVQYGDQLMALKWYFKNKMQNPQQFYDNVQNNINVGKPADSFLWPVDMTDWIDGTFGYVMPLRPAGYEDFSKYLLAKVKFKSLTAWIDSALNIVESFKILHEKGYNYQDLNDGNFFIDYATGDVLICDNDNVMGHGYASGIAGKCRYMAPEVVRGEKMPDKQTDRFSLAIVLFLLLFNNHPLEGKATNPPCMTESLEKKYYGTHPRFIFDPADATNRPIPGIHQNALNKWGLFPDYIRNQFEMAFSQEQLHNLKPRPLDSDWLKLFLRLRSDIIKCGCGNEFFATTGQVQACDSCKKQLAVPAYLKVQKFSVPLFPGVVIYPYHTVVGNHDFKSPVAEIIASKKKVGYIGIRNLSDTTWYVIGENGKQTPKGNGEVVTIAIGTKIDFGRNLAGEIIAG